jgi:ABC-type multidrug transport system fused ATPase/permease subunit
MSRASLSWTEMVADRRPRTLALLRSFAPFLRGQRSRIAAVVALGLVSAAVELAALSLLMPLYDLVAGRNQTVLFAGTPLAALGERLALFEPNDRVRWIVVLLFACAFTREAMGYANSLLCANVQLRLTKVLRREVLRRMFAMPMHIYTQRASNNQFYILSTFAQMGGDFVFAAARMIVPAALFSLYIGVLVYLSPEMTLIAAIVGITVLTAARLVLVRQQKWAAKAAAEGSDLNHFSMQMMAALRNVHLMNRDREFAERHDRMLDRWIRSAVGTARYQGLIAPLNQISASLALLLIVFVGASFSVGDSIDWLGFVVMFLIVMMRLSGPVGTLNSIRSEIAGRSAGADFLMEFLARNPDRPIGSAPAASGLPGDIEVLDVSFHYGDGREVLRGIDLRISRGSTIALVGRSGAGKSTLLDLLTKLAAPTSGRILCAGTDIRLIPDEVWRAEIGVVSQSPFLFDDTLRENIRIAKPGASDEEIEAAAKLANVDEFARRMPDGYDSWIGERGVLLSGGQAQRVAIARTILANPSLLILDEATSAQDSESEAAIQSALDRLSRDRTVIIVAHRLATVKRADTIYVLDNGTIIESGKHADLIALDGRYRRFVELQSLDIAEGRAS